jgi:hypothetical protein
MVMDRVCKCHSIDRTTGRFGIATYRTIPRSVVQLLTTVADWLHNLTFDFVTNLAQIKNYLKNSLLHASGVLHYLT